MEKMSMTSIRKRSRKTEKVSSNLSKHERAKLSSAKRSKKSTRAILPRRRSSAFTGLKVQISIIANDGIERDEKHVEIIGSFRPAVGGVKGEFPLQQDRESAARRVSRGTNHERLTGLLSAMAHPQRIRILIKLLGGEATHQLLAKTTQLKSGPLYHHLRELRSTGLIGPKVRDLYILTAAGRRAILAAIAMERLCR